MCVRHVCLSVCHQFSQSCQSVSLYQLNEKEQIKYDRLPNDIIYYTEKGDEYSLPNCNKKVEIQTENREKPKAKELKKLKETVNKPKLFM